MKLVPVKPVPRANTLYCIPIYAYRIAPSPLSCFVCACVPVGGAQDRVEIYLIAHPDDDQTKARRLLTEQFSTFNAGKAQCFLASDREHLLAVIEAGFGDFDDFNRVARSLLANRVHRMPSLPTSRAKWNSLSSRVRRGLFATTGATPSSANV